MTIRSELVAGVAAMVLAGIAFAGTASAETLDRIRQAGAIRIAYRDDAPPFSLKGEGGTPAGYSVELCRAVADDIKRQLKLAKLDVDYVQVTAADRFEAIEKDRADLLCEATTATLSRRKLVDFSISTFVSGASLMIKPGGPATYEALAGKKIGVLGGTTTEQALRNSLAERRMKADVLVVKTHPDGIRMLAAGEIAAYFGDRTILQFMQRDDKVAAGLLLANDYLTFEPYALAVPHGDDAFRLAVDTALSRIYRSGDIQAIFVRTFGKNVKPSDLVKALYLIASMPE
jgi:polar amino acid transport system substrate-binding protein/glutamate/aspartate transport system substrate-binding protein